MSEIAGTGCEILATYNERKPLEEIERSIIKKYRKPIWSKFVKAISDFKMVEEGDKVAVAISGGKDSLLMAKLFQELKRHRKVNFELEFIAMDPGYHTNIKDLLLDNCKHLNIPVYVFESQIFAIAEKIAKDYPCYMCAKMRRGALYAKAQELGCNKLALGHHFNDVIETTMLNLIYTGNFGTMMPKLKSQNFDGLELIRPLYHVEEESIVAFTQENGIWPLNCACMVAAKQTANKRYEIKKLIKDLKAQYFEDADKSIFKATQNVSKDCIIAWREKGELKSFLDFYDK